MVEHIEDEAEIDTVTLDRHTFSYPLNPISGATGQTSVMEARERVNQDATLG